MSSTIGAAGAAMSATFRRFERSAARVAEGSEPGPDLVRETVEQTASRASLAAQVAVARTADQMTGELINLWV